MKAAIVFISLVFLLGCTPYTTQIRELDRAYKAGRVDPGQYAIIRSQLAGMDSQYRQIQAQQIAAGIAVGAQSYNQSYQNQQWLNAYNRRTVMMTYPQTVNVEHSGTIYLHQY